MTDSTPCMLNFPEYEYWYKAIESDDYKMLYTELEENDGEYRKQLLNGTFNLEFNEEHDGIPIPTVSKAWHLVVSLCSKETSYSFPKVSTCTVKMDLKTTLYTL